MCVGVLLKVNARIRIVFFFLPSWLSGIVYTDCLKVLLLKSFSCGLSASYVITDTLAYVFFEHMRQNSLIQLKVKIIESDLCAREWAFKHLHDNILLRLWVKFDESLVRKPINWLARGVRGAGTTRAISHSTRAVWDVSLENSPMGGVRSICCVALFVAVCPFRSHSSVKTLVILLLYIYFFLVYSR